MIWDYDNGHRRQEGSDDAVLLVVGNKSDLIDRDAVDELEWRSRQVPAAAARRLADVSHCPIFDHFVNQVPLASFFAPTFDEWPLTTGK